MTQAQHPYPQPQVAPAPRPRRPPLPKRQRRAAALAGGLGFTLITIGWTAGLAAIGALAFVNVFVWIVDLIGQGNGGGPEYDELVAFLVGLNTGAWTLPLAIAALAGVALIVAGLITSAALLRRAGATSPGGITWAGFGIAVVGYWALGWIPWTLAQFVAGLLPVFGVSTWLFSLLATLGFALLATLAISAVVGWLAWWWMAWAMRPAAAAPQA